MEEVSEEEYAKVFVHEYEGKGEEEDGQDFLGS